MLWNNCSRNIRKNVTLVTISNFCARSDLCKILNIFRNPTIRTILTILTKILYNLDNSYNFDNLDKKILQSWQIRQIRQSWQIRQILSQKIWQIFCQGNPYKSDNFDKSYKYIVLQILQFWSKSYIRIYYFNAVISI